MPDITRRGFLERAAMGAAAGTLAAADPSRASAARRCNVLVLRSDEHNPRVCEVYGHPRVHTPNMRRLARMGTVFESCYCPSPLCMPSRSATMAGRWVHELQTYSNCNVFPADHPTYGRVLREQGVHTVHIGKTDVYAPADRLGFSEMILPGDRPPPGDLNIARHPLAIRRGDGQQRANGWGPRDGNPHAHDDVCVDAAMAWLEKTAPALRVPWTLEVNIGAPHFPHLVTPEEWAMYPDGGDLPRHGRECASADHPVARDLRAHFETDTFTEAQTRGLRRGYLGCVTYVDRQLGRLLDALERAGLRESTLVAYTSDHGEMLGTFGMWWKCSLYEDSARVPLIVAGPGFGRGRRVRTPVSQMDLKAALFRAVGARRPESWRGAPLQDVPADDPERPVFCEYHGHGTRCSSYLIRKGRWKLLYHADAPHQLFDLERDPYELADLSATRRDVLAELEADLRLVCDPDVEHRRTETYIRRQLRAMRDMGVRLPETA